MTEETEQVTWGAQANASTSDGGSLPMRTRKSLGETFSGDRDLYDTLGYDEELTVEDYWDRYLRQDIARTIVDAPAQTTWREQPEVTDDDDDESMTAFERDIQTLWREHELQSRLDAVDRLAGIGHFGVLVVGFKDGRELSRPVNEAAISSPDDIAYFMPIAEDRVEEWELVDDEQDDRFNLPERYRIDFADRDRMSQHSKSHTLGGEDDVREVHHQRVIHVPAGNTLDNLLMGRPRLEAVFNRLQDLEKVIGASSEAIWRAADYGLALQSDPEHAGQMPDSEKENIEQELQSWFHGLQPFLRLSGFDVEKLDGNPQDPTGVFEALIKLVAGETGIPQRILTGSERGELASTQDRASWLGRISERQTNFAEPQILRPLVDMLAEYGALSTPQGDGEESDNDGRAYEIEWPNLFELSETEQAEISAKLAQALNRARDPNSAEPIMSPGEVRSEVFNLDPELGAEVDIDEDLPEPGDESVEDLLPDPADMPGGDSPPGEGDEPGSDGDDDSPESDDADEQSAVQAQFGETTHVSDLRADGGQADR